MQRTIDSGIASRVSVAPRTSEVFSHLPTRIGILLIGASLTLSVGGELVLSPSSPAMGTMLPLSLAMAVVAIPCCVRVFTAPKTHIPYTAAAMAFAAISLGVVIAWSSLLAAVGIPPVDWVQDLQIPLAIVSTSAATAFGMPLLRQALWRRGLPGPETTVVRAGEAVRHASDRLRAVASPQVK